MANNIVLNELIDDRSIEEASDDTFRHEDVVIELAHLIDHCEGQTNIALFAPWGSGKTGISRLLRARVEDKRKKRRYVYFDAFKHRDTPLRRSFLRRVATELGKSPSSVDDLWREETTQGLERRNGWALAGYISLALLIGLLLMAGVSALMAIVRPETGDQTYWTSFVLLFTRLGGVASLVAALLGVVIAGFVGGITVTRTKTPISEDDEFETEFERLADETSRLVVFIDELDRCSADEVVATLETMRVFLEVQNCIFVVAADRQALEQALKRKARQETPADEVNPYFSSAGSYIDKIFQFQVSLPPLRWTDTGEFAQNLVSNRGGLWQELRDWGELHDVLAALVPTHVTSPRRVKVLLNTYVLEHRLAQRRVDAGGLLQLKGRAAELAQIVCLKVEFPIFADELRHFPKLPEAVLEQSGVGEQSDLEQTAPETWSRAVEILRGDKALAPLLYDPKRVSAPTEETPSSEPGT